MHVCVVLYACVHVCCYTNKTEHIWTVYSYLYSTGLTGSSGISVNALISNQQSEMFYRIKIVHKSNSRFQAFFVT